MNEEKIDKMKRIKHRARRDKALEALVLAQQRQMEEMREQLAKQQAPAHAMPMPKPPKEVFAPKTVRWKFKRLYQDPLSKNGDPWSGWNVDLPDDPRICVFCSLSTWDEKEQKVLQPKNIAAEYHYDISINPTPEQTVELRRIHEMHRREMAGLKKSEKIEERRAAANHTELVAEVVGTTPNIVAKFLGKELTAEEYNEWMKQQYEYKMQNLAMNR